MNATTATALVSGFPGTNPKIIQRWPSSCHHDTPGNTRDQGQLLKQGLNSKLSDRTRWRRGRDERWDAARMQAYAEFGNAVKEVFHLATRIAKGRGMPYSAEPLNPGMEAMSALNDAESRRARAWESVLLLGDPETVEAGRTWWHEVWRFVWFARGWLTDTEQWEDAIAESDPARQRFYECARRDLGVKGTAAAIGPPEPRWLSNAEAAMHPDNGLSDRSTDIPHLSQLRGAAPGRASRQACGTYGADPARRATLGATADCPGSSSHWRYHVRRGPSSSAYQCPGHGRRVKGAYGVARDRFATLEYARHGRSIGGESPLEEEVVLTPSRRQLRRREAEWEGSPRRNPAPRNTNRV